MKKSYFFEELTSLLCVKPPLLMVDALTVDVEGRCASGRKAVTQNDPVFQGHFPEYAVEPGVLQVAAMSQLSQALFEELYPGEGIPFVAGLRRVKFRSPVRPGMLLSLEGTVGEETETGVEFSVKVTAEDGALCSSGFITLARRSKEFFRPEPAEGVPPYAESMAPEALLAPPKLMEVIPHRFPFMLLDGAYGLSMAGAVGLKNVTVSDPLVQSVTPAHFPGFLQIEAAAQLGCAAMLSQPENQGLLGFFMSIDEATFLRPVLPGERLTFNATCEPRGKFGIANGEFYVGATKVAIASIKFALVPAEMKE
ncbi:MAG: hypothetical protein IJJ26_08695 [Victivallales bacterium]|nr:hypothetical protein [Victivallales bacterium]